MSGTHKTNHQYKKKERKRTGLDDPKKIKTHRKRYVKKLDKRSGKAKPGSNVGLKIFLKYITENNTTIIQLFDKELSQVPFLAIKPEDLHYEIHNNLPDFDDQVCTARLKAHVDKAFHTKTQCVMQIKQENILICKAAFKCRFRKWSEQKCLPQCSIRAR